MNYASLNINVAIQNLNMNHYQIQSRRLQSLILGKIEAVKWNAFSAY